MSELGFNIEGLQKLLNVNENDSSDDDEKPLKNLSAKLGPGNIASSSKKTNKEEKKSAYEKKVTKDIWDENEVEEGAEFDTNDDPRNQPDYEIIYKQKITTEEMFLQMGNKTPATSSCEEMIIKIKLPGVEKLTDIDLNLFEKFLDCRTIQYRLGLHLPHPIDPNKSNAKWDSSESSLIVTTTMQREYDFVNF